MSFDKKSDGPSVCLAMIVKDEKHIIGKLLASVKNHIDYVVICDTGSTDGTQEYIGSLLNDMKLSGKVLDRPWIDFGTNRSEALAMARDESKCDYTLMLDADEVLEEIGTDEAHVAGKDVYTLSITLGQTNYFRRMLFSNKVAWRYEGVLHEYPACDDHDKVTQGHMPGWHVKSVHAGARSKDKDIYRRDAAVLQKAIIDEPGNSRYCFYLAQSYFDHEDWLLAERYYRKRLEMSGYAEEIWFSLVRLAEIAERTVGEGSSASQQYYLDAYALDPSRAEPMFRMAMIYAKAKKWALAELFMSRACLIPDIKEGRLFLLKEIYDWRRHFEYAVILHYCGNYKDSIALNERLLESGRLPKQHEEQAHKNIDFSKAALERIEPSGPASADHKPKETP